MRIGLISDVHGDIDALQLALQTLRAVAVDTILCAGDLVDYGDHSEKVVNQIFDEQIPCVQGNHDRTAAYNQSLWRRSSTADDVRGTISGMLSKETCQRLAQLPLTRRFEWHATQLLLAHSTPGGDDMYIYPDSSLPLLRRVIADANEADVIVLGHTHRPMWLELDGVTLLNPGSVSLNYFRDVNTCGVLSLPDREFVLLDVQTGRGVPLQKDSRDDA